jgi:hypothetical protein
MQRIPCDPGLVRYEMRVLLGENQHAFWLQFRWNTRLGIWFMNVLDSDRNPIAMSRGVVVGPQFLFNIANPARPAGVFVAVDTTGGGVDPGLGELGGRVQLYFVTAADVAAGA